MICYKFTNENGTPCNGGHGEWNLPIGHKPGKWMPPIKMGGLPQTAERIATVRATLKLEDGEFLKQDNAEDCENIEKGGHA